MIAASGSGGIGTIGAAIGEALVVTGYGLIVAIPSVLVFNWLSGRIANYEARPAQRRQRAGRSARDDGAQRACQRQRRQRRRRTPRPPRRRPRVRRPHRPGAGAAR